jgi:hemin uptake protein HemP
MSAYLEAVEQARERREHTHAADAQAQAAFIHAIRVARNHHSLRAIAAAGGITHNGVVYLLQKSEGK